MWRIRIRSRVGNAILGILGALYFAAGIAVLVYYLVTTWGADTNKDRILQLALFCSALTGLLLMAVARANLGIRVGGAVRSPLPPEHRTTAEARS